MGDDRIEVVGVDNVLKHISAWVPLRLYSGNVEGVRNAWGLPDGGGWVASWGRMWGIPIVEELMDAIQDARSVCVYVLSVWVPYGLDGASTSLIHDEFVAQFFIRLVELLSLFLKVLPSEYLFCIPVFLEVVLDLFEFFQEIVLLLCCG
jgi:hypothetical protein